MTCKQIGQGCIISLVAQELEVEMIVLRGQNPESIAARKQQVRGTKEMATCG